MTFFFCGIKHLRISGYLFRCQVVFIGQNHVASYFRERIPVQNISDIGTSCLAIKYSNLLRQSRSQIHLIYPLYRFTFITHPYLHKPLCMSSGQLLINNFMENLPTNTLRFEVEQFPRKFHSYQTWLWTYLSQMSRFSLYVSEQ